VANYRKHEYVHHFHARVRNYVRVDRRATLPCFFSIAIRQTDRNDSDSLILDIIYNMWRIVNNYIFEITSIK